MDKFCETMKNPYTRVCIHCDFFKSFQQGVKVWG